MRSAARKKIVPAAPAPVEAPPVGLVTAVPYREDDLVEVTFVSKSVKQRFLLKKMRIEGVSSDGHFMDHNHAWEEEEETKNWLQKLLHI